MNVPGRYHLIRKAYGRFLWVETRPTLESARRWAKAAQVFYAKHNTAVQHVIAEDVGGALVYHEAE